MSRGLDNLRLRFNYYGGENQQIRMQKDKLRSLKKSLLYSYQAVTIALMDENNEFSEDSKKFRALINPDKNKGDYDDKILSIPYEDICLNSKDIKDKTSNGIEKINLNPGDVFEWVENNTKWIIYLKFLEETAYLRAEIRRCDQQTEISGKKYWVYTRGPTETSIQWNQKGGVEWNDLNYSMVMYITKDENTANFFHRFQTLKVIEPSTNNFKTWQIVGTNPYYGDGIIQVYLDEFFENEIEEAGKKEKEDNTPPAQNPDPESIYIDGPDKVKAYDEVMYSIVNSDSGVWSIEFNNETFMPSSYQTEKNNSDWLSVQKTPDIIIQQENNIDIKVILNVSRGNFTIFYKGEEGNAIAKKEVAIIV